jgi:hypothetical protein
VCVRGSFGVEVAEVRGLEVGLWLVVLGCVAVVWQLCGRMLVEWLQEVKVTAWHLRAWHGFIL